MVFDGPDGHLKALWTQSTFEGMPDQRVVFTESCDGGHTWAPIRVIAGPVPPATGGMASWAFPMLSRSGRLYVLYSRHIGVNDVFTHTTGLMAGIYSDDAGRTWSPEALVAMRRSKLDHPDPAASPKANTSLGSHAGSVPPSAIRRRMTTGRRMRPSWSSCVSKT
jgi:hypothetical protein